MSISSSYFVFWHVFFSHHWCTSAMRGYLFLDTDIFKLNRFFPLRLLRIHALAYVCVTQKKLFTFSTEKNIKSLYNNLFIMYGLFCTLKRARERALPTNKFICASERRLMDLLLDFEIDFVSSKYGEFEIIFKIEYASFTGCFMYFNFRFSLLFLLELVFFVFVGYCWFSLALIWLHCRFVHLPKS